MSSSAPTRPLRLPPADLAQRTIPRARLPARAWYRVHPTGHDAIHFSLNPTHRFSHSNCPYKFLYLGTNPETCLWERFGDTVFGQDHRILKKLWMDTSISVIKSPALPICDLGRTDVRNALNVDMAALMSYDLSVPQAWGLALQWHPASFAGIKFKSRFTMRPCFALFDQGDIKSALKQKGLGPLASFEAALDWLEKFEIQLV